MHVTFAAGRPTTLEIFIAYERAKKGADLQTGANPRFQPFRPRGSMVDDCSWI